MPVRAIWLALSLVLCCATASLGQPADAAKSAAALKSLRAELDALPRSEPLTGSFTTVPLTRPDAALARELLWKTHATRIEKERADEIKAGVLKEGTLEMPFSFETFGKKPAKGWSLWLSLHGGGGTTKQVNDQQWNNQKRLYTLEEGMYLAPRAPTNTWNLWHEAHIDRLFARLIEDLIVLEGVDPNRVYVLGYSAGGDGVYQLAPRLADRWAAASMMAGHPNDASPLNLRNVPFALQVGGKDAAYQRNAKAAEWGEKLAKLHKDDPKGYETFFKIHPEKGHWMDLEDKAALPWMAKFTRNPVPTRVVWRQSAGTDRMYWLAVGEGEAKSGSIVVATRDGQTVDIEKAEGVKQLRIRLDDRMLDLDKPVKVTYQGKVLFEGVVHRNIAAMTATLQGRGDPELTFDAEVSVEIP